MDGILALGHFCESHGPCVILCTQRCKEEPKQFPHSLTVPVCEACQSLDLEQAMVSKGENTCYVTTRTPLQQDLAFLLKQAVVRSLSCEETSKDGGTLYFGDNERGHVISHIFSVHDSLARGFLRKYCILLLMRDRIHLLNSWPFITKHVKQISEDLQKKSEKVNNIEQMHKSQRAVRQAQGSPTSVTRSLSQLTGEPAVFAHMHLWFTWLLSAETVVEKPLNVPEFPVECNALRLREIIRNMSQDVFHKVCYCFLTGIKVETNDQEITPTFQQLLPKKFTLPKTGDVCKLEKNNDGSYSVVWSGCLPQKLPTLLRSVESALRDTNLPDLALNSYITSLLLKWHNIASVICQAPSNSSELLKALGVQKCDMPLLSYWIAYCKS
ncbi:folliculin [Cylas formicarius]|uniref:folliculin n=1 Tax=Cylas formicarius TaxID=197179 RepID=UPI002958CE18|nr:folliculin [Cylas formicarius]